jgi:hypothetical protein
MLILEIASKPSSPYTEGLYKQYISDKDSILLIEEALDFLKNRFQTKTKGVIRILQIQPGTHQIYPEDIMQNEGFLTTNETMIYQAEFTAHKNMVALNDTASS